MRDTEIAAALAVCWCILIMTSAAPSMTREEVKKYLTDMQFLGSNNPNETMKQMEEEDEEMAFTEALKNAQRMYLGWNISVTGEIDEPTVALMQLPRCGNPDMVPEMMMRRKKRYLLQGGTWTKNPLTWKIRLYPQDEDLTEAQVDQEIERAFLIWAEVSPLRFVQLSQTDDTIADIDILFVDSFIDHGDGSPFDGPSGTLAHAFFPGQGQISGDSHFDNAEVWTIKSALGINLFQVAAHEFGHAFGLGHSMVPNALMAPFYQGYVPDFQLPEDDILGIQAKYGQPVSSTTAPPATPAPTTQEPLDPDIQDEMDTSTVEFCNSPSFDAITTILVKEDNYRTYAFREDVVFLLENDGTIAPGYPRPIGMLWPGLPSNLDAAVFWDAEYEYEWAFNEELWEWEMERTKVLNAVTFVFKGNNYWEIDSSGVRADYPRSLTAWRVPDNLESIDTIFKWGTTGLTYFVSGSQYWAYSEEANGFVPGYPRPVSNWGSFQGSVNAAFHSYGLNQLVFFTDDKFYPFNDSTFATEEGYPKDIVPHWVKCPEGDLISGAPSTTVPNTSICVALYLVFVRGFLPLLL